MAPKGAIAVTVTKPTAVLSGSHTPPGESGTIAAAARKPVATLAATMPPSGVVAASARKPVANLAAVMHPQGIIAVTIIRLRFTATGAETTEIIGDIAATLNPPAFAAVGAHREPTPTERTLIVTSTGRLLSVGGQLIAYAPP
jgi:hypothetical protein